GSDLERFRGDFFWDKGSSPHKRLTENTRKKGIGGGGRGVDYNHLLIFPIKNGCVMDWYE
ncbi:TPA: hypothetical protein ACJF21_004474, partial [Salmonella enterica subsp. enterica serovar Javiana]